VDDGRSNTLNTFDIGVARSTHLVVEGDRARILTSREWERLFGYPDDWTDVEGIPDAGRYKMLGNSISTNVTHWLGDRLVAAPLLAPT
jgi:site-specific DNA-cytosine methylase